MLKPHVWRCMKLRDILRKVFLCIALGGPPVLGAGMSQEKIEELLHAMNQTRVEVTISDDDETQHAWTGDGCLFETPTSARPKK